MGATSATFEAMYSLTSTIKQIDSITEQDGDDMLERVFTAVKDINLEQLDKEVKYSIVTSIREGLLKLYKERQIAVNKEIGLGLSFDSVEKEMMNGEHDTLISNHSPIAFPTAARYERVAHIEAVN